MVCKYGINIDVGIGFGSFKLPLNWLCLTTSSKRLFQYYIEIFFVLDCWRTRERGIGCKSNDKANAMGKKQMDLFFFFHFVNNQFIRLCCHCFSILLYILVFSCWCLYYSDVEHNTQRRRGWNEKKNWILIFPAPTSSIWLFKCYQLNVVYSDGHILEFLILFIWNIFSNS